MKLSRIDIIGQNGNDGTHYGNGGVEMSGGIEDMLKDAQTRQENFTGGFLKHKPGYYGTNDPYRYALDNDLGPLEMNIIKYVTRHRFKDKKMDLLKARETLDRLIEEIYTKHE